jgi:hypothetical protein
MKSVIPILGFSAALLAGGATAAEVQPPIVARAEACLRANVERVVAVEPDLQSAAKFLVDFACAIETSAAARYERNVSWLVSMRAFSKGIPKSFANSSMSFEVDASVDPETGEFVIPEPKSGAQPSAIASMLPQMSMSSGVMFPDVTPVALRRLAGELVLAVREREKRKR